MRSVPDTEEVTPLRYIKDVRLSETPYKHVVRHPEIATLSTRTSGRCGLSDTNEVAPAEKVQSVFTLRN